MTVPDDRVRRVALPDQGRRQDISKAFLTLKYAHDSASALLQALRTVRSERQASRGALTDEEQDLLRAMLVMSASGLDSMAKQLLRDAIPILCTNDEEVLSGFQGYVSRQLKGDSEGHITSEVAKLLSRVLTADSVQSALIETYIFSLTGGSLQSVDELYKVASALGIPHSMIDKRVLKPIFDARNNIIHELDIDFSAPRRNRRSRRMGETISATNELLRLAERFYTECEERLNNLSGQGFLNT